MLLPGWRASFSVGSSSVTWNQPQAEWERKQTSRLSMRNYRRCFFLDMVFEIGWNFRRKHSGCVKTKNTFKFVSSFCSNKASVCPTLTCFSRSAFLTKATWWLYQLMLWRQHWPATPAPTSPPWPLQDPAPGVCKHDGSSSHFIDLWFQLHSDLVSVHDVFFFHTMINFGWFVEILHDLLLLHVCLFFIFLSHSTHFFYCIIYITFEHIAFIVSFYFVPGGVLATVLVWYVVWLLSEQQDTKPMKTKEKIHVINLQTKASYCESSEKMYQSKVSCNVAMPSDCVRGCATCATWVTSGKTTHYSTETQLAYSSDCITLTSSVPRAFLHILKGTWCHKTHDFSNVWPDASYVIFHNNTYMFHSPSDRQFKPAINKPACRWQILCRWRPSSRCYWSRPGDRNRPHTSPVTTIRKTDDKNVSPFCFSVMTTTLFKWWW